MAALHEAIDGPDNPNGKLTGGFSPAVYADLGPAIINIYAQRLRDNLEITAKLARNFLEHTVIVKVDFDYIRVFIGLPDRAPLSRQLTL